MRSGGLWVLVAFGVACAASAASLPLWRALCRRWGHVDDPGHRKIHVQPIPLAGGFAVMTGWLLGGLGMLILESSGALGKWKSEALWSGTEGALRFGVLVMGGLGMLALGAWDDRRDLKAGVKVLVQGGIAAGVAGWGVRVPAPEGMPFLAYVLTVFWILAITNAFNLSDNMNGLCSGLGVIGAVFVSFLSFFGHEALGVACAAALTAGSLAGYLPYNYPRATVFLGDAGSQWVGYTMSVLSLLSASPFQPREGGVVRAWIVLFAVVAVPAIDMAFVVVSRTWKGIPFWVGDTNHLSHRLSRTRLGKAGAVALLWVLACLLGTLLSR